ncbi:MAG: ParB N-terminal domain-containing protein [Acidobacteria bacterium]|nr:ParB N-terminal domain-containing protein [Acidobacteriota bacterium]
MTSLQKTTTSSPAPDKQAGMSLKRIGRNQIPIADIKIENSFQIRKCLNEEAIDDYAAAMQSGEEFPPVVVLIKGNAYYLIDGFHRFHAAKKAGLEKISAEIREGDNRQAILFAVGANTAHGLRLTNEDKRRAVSMLLKDPELRQWSDREIARRCKVSNTLVSNLRNTLSTVDSVATDSSRPSEDEENKTRTYKNKQGSTSVMKTAQIGQRRKSSSKSKSEQLDEAQKDCNENPPGSVSNEMVSRVRPNPFDWVKEGIEQSRSFFLRIRSAGGLSVLLKESPDGDRHSLEEAFSALINEAQECVSSGDEIIRDKDNSEQVGDAHSKALKSKSREKRGNNGNESSSEDLPREPLAEKSADEKPSHKNGCLPPKAQTPDTSFQAQVEGKPQQAWMKKFSARIKAIKDKDQREKTLKEGES